MVIEIPISKEIHPENSHKKKKQDKNVKDSLFLDLAVAVKEIVTSSTKGGMITMKMDEVIGVGYEDKASVCEYLLRPVIKQVEKETGIDTEEMISEGKIGLNINRDRNEIVCWIK